MRHCVLVCLCLSAAACNTPAPPSAGAASRPEGRTPASRPLPPETQPVTRSERPKTTKPDPPLTTHRSGLTDKELQFDFDLLGEKEQFEILAARKRIEDKGFVAVETEERELFFKHMKFFATPKVKERVQEWADEKGAKEVLRDLGHDGRKDVRALKVRFALELNPLEVVGISRIAKQVKAKGLGSIEGVDREIVDAHRWLFFPPKE